MDNMLIKFEETITIILSSIRHNNIFYVYW